MSELPVLPLDTALQQAGVHHEAGRLAEAERLYREILREHPRNADAHHHLGVLAAQLGKPALGLPHLKIALESDPYQDRRWLAYAGVLLAAGHAQDASTILEQARQRGISGQAFEGLMARVREFFETDSIYATASEHHQAGRMTEAIDFYTRVVARDSGRVGAHVNLGNALVAQNRLEEAIAAFRRALQLEPDNAEVHNNLGNTLERQGKHDEAEDSYKHALNLVPDYAEAHYNLGIALNHQGKPAEAESSYRRALALRPDFAKAFYNLGSVLCELGRTEEGFAAIMRSAELTYAASADGSSGNEPPPPHKTQHDREQRDYLKGKSAHDFNAPFCLADGSRLTVPAINPDNAADIAEKWRTNRPQIVVIDNLLTEQALDKLRRFCWGSTVWRKTYDDGYLGAMPEYGFASPLLAQIAEELRTTFPTIFRAHPLRYLWAFKYDSRLAGINIHADDAAVNVNFWITPDEANLDPEHGGLVIWDVAAPLDWNFDKYNGDVAASRDFLARAGAKPVTVPYRANRAVIFDSDLFHETDKIAFKDGYLNRRINVTLLYGPRIPGEK